MQPTGLANPREPGPVRFLLRAGHDNERATHWVQVAERTGADYLICELPTRETMGQTPDIHAVRRYLQGLQGRITSTLEAVDGRSRFGDDPWERLPGGRGRTRVLEDGAVFERAAVGFSHVLGDALPPAASASRPELTGRSFQALGVSLVVHPKNPYVPTSHANVRFFVTTLAREPAVWWFGGGFDLTPYYGFEEDARHWHRIAHDAVAPFGRGHYDRFKRWCDDYFFLKHRQEQRGIGGLFFDDYAEGGFGRAFALAQSVGDHYLEAYLPIVGRRRHRPYGPRQREFQLYRRGRYVEFNLIYDRGTLFGLQRGGRAESILISMPPLASWRYAWRPEEASEEARLIRDFLRPRDWLVRDPERAGEADAEQPAQALNERWASILGVSRPGGSTP